ncbi:MAG: PIN domain-containing protein [Bacteroidales bacterium]|nr:PIN domain-containing protein [Bacteroidales bacterium]
MSRYFLDTHIVIWLVTNETKLDDDLRFDIEYPSGNQYVTSEFVLLEIMHLKQLGKINFTGSAEDILRVLSSMNISVDMITSDAFRVLDGIPILTIKKDRHTDMIDRIIIANCIANKYTLISHDSKFPHYRKYGLKLLEA